MFLHGYQLDLSLRLGELLNFLALVATLLYLSGYVRDTKRIAEGTEDQTRISNEIAQATAEGSEAAITPCLDFARATDPTLGGAVAAAQEGLNNPSDTTAGSVRSVIEAPGNLRIINVGTGPALNVAFRIPDQNGPGVWREAPSIPAGGSQLLGFGLLQTNDRSRSELEIRYASLSHTQYQSLLEVIDGNFVKRFSFGRVTLIGGREATGTVEFPAALIR